jgi:small subunit ribosomal protein S1
VANYTPTQEEFSTLLADSFEENNAREGGIVKGTVIAIEKDLAIIDVGLKTEGVIPLKEFSEPGQEGSLSIGDCVDVYLERVENALGEAIISRDKAKREMRWITLEESCTNRSKVNGVIVNSVKGGYTVDLDGVFAFLPKSQLDVRPLQDVSSLIGASQTFYILKMDRRRGNIVVSRRLVLEETRSEARSDAVANLQEGQVLEGIVKNVTPYGAFVDLGGVDGLLHVTDMAWRRVTHPSDVVTIGTQIKVKIIKINHETHRISLGIKQLTPDPWESIAEKYVVGSQLHGTVTNLTDYGAFVELESGIEGLIHVSEMSWAKRNVHPSKLLTLGQKVDVQVMEVDPSRRRISLGLKQVAPNPWATFSENHPIGSEITGDIRNKTEFGLFVGLEGDIDGMIHLSDLDWHRPGEEVIESYARGQTIRAIVLDVDVEKERISLGVKQLTADPFGEVGDLKRGSVVTCEILDVKENGLEVKIVDTDLTTFIRRSELARDRSEQRVERFATGERIDAQVVQFDRKAHRVVLSIKAFEVSEEQAAIAQYGSTDSGASLGDILGVALNNKKGTNES